MNPPASWKVRHDGFTHYTIYLSIYLSYLSILSEERNGNMNTPDGITLLPGQLVQFHEEDAGHVAYSGRPDAGQVGVGATVC